MTQSWFSFKFALTLFTPNPGLPGRQKGATDEGPKRHEPKVSPNSGERFRDPRFGVHGFRGLGFAIYGFKVLF